MAYHFKSEAAWRENDWDYEYDTEEELEEKQREKEMIKLIRMDDEGRYRVRFYDRHVPVKEEIFWDLEDAQETYPDAQIDF